MALFLVRRGCLISGRFRESEQLLLQPYCALGKAIRKGQRTRLDSAISQAEETSPAPIANRIAWAT